MVPCHTCRGDCCERQRVAVVVVVEVALVHRLVINAERVVDVAVMFAVVVVVVVDDDVVVDTVVVVVVVALVPIHCA